MARYVSRVGVMRWPWIPGFAGMTELGMPEAATHKLLRLGVVASRVPLEDPQGP